MFTSLGWFCDITVRSCSLGIDKLGSHNTTSALLATYATHTNWSDNDRNSFETMHKNGDKSSHYAQVELSRRDRANPNSLRPTVVHSSVLQTKSLTTLAWGTIKNTLLNGMNTVLMTTKSNLWTMGISIPSQTTGCVSKSRYNESHASPIGRTSEKKFWNYVKETTLAPINHMKNASI